MQKGGARKEHPPFKARPASGQGRGGLHAVGAIGAMVRGIASDGTDVDQRPVMGRRVDADDSVFGHIAAQFEHIICKNWASHKDSSESLWCKDRLCIAKRAIFRGFGGT